MSPGVRAPELRKVITLPASHASLASKPEEVSELIDEESRSVT